MSVAKRARIMAAPKASWLPVAADSDFSIANIPFGVVATTAAPDAPFIATRVGDSVVSLKALVEEGVLPADYKATLTSDVLNGFMALGRKEWKDVRTRLQCLLSDEDHPDHDPALRTNAALQAKVVFPVSATEPRLPAHIGDYTDFYSSREHATNVGIMFRGVANALQPNWLHLPVGYHGRASSVVVTGTDFKRPCGQLQVHPEDATKGSVYGPSKQLDFELEIGMFVGPGNKMGEPIDIASAEDHIFGLVLLNDWSARDIQKWEYVPLGPFGAKNFCTTISPWIVTMEALEPFICETSAVEQTDPVPLPYLRDPKYGSYDIALEVDITGKDMAAPATVSKSNFKYLYWSIRQQLVHHTVTGCNMRPGDLLGSGTISGPTPGSFGSMLELAWKGTKPVDMPDGSKRVFLQDGDTVNVRGFCAKDGVRVGFGDCAGKILPATPYVDPAAASAGAASAAAAGGATGGAGTAAPAATTA